MSIKKNNASSNIVYKGLRDDILSLKLIPGSAISETDIASKYNGSLMNQKFLGNLLRKRTLLLSDVVLTLFLRI